MWDTEQQYTRDRLDVYYMSHSGKPISEEQLTEVGQCNSGLGPQPQTTADDSTTVAYHASMISEGLTLKLLRCTCVPAAAAGH